MRVMSFVMVVVLASANQISLASQFSVEKKQLIEDMNTEEAAYTLMSELIKAGDEEAVKKYLDEGGKLAIEYGFKKDSSGTCNAYHCPTPLLQAVIAKNYTMAQLLLEAGDDPNSVNMEHGTPLQHAVRERDAAIMDLLFEYGACNEAGGFDQVALVTAIQNRDIATIHKLMAYGADVNYGGIPDDLYPQYDTPMTMAAKIGDVEMVKLLMACGADIHQRAPTWLTPLQTALLMDHMPAAKLLLTFGAGQQGNENNPLLNESMDDGLLVPSLPVMRLLFKHGITGDKKILNKMYHRDGEVVEQMRLLLGVKSVSEKLLDKSWVKEKVGLVSGRSLPEDQLLYHVAHENVQKLFQAIRANDLRRVRSFIQTMQDIHVYEPAEPVTLNTPLHAAVKQYVAYNNAYNAAVASEQKEAEKYKTALKDSEDIIQSLFMASPQLWDTPNIYDETPFDALATKNLINKFEGITPKKLTEHHKAYAKELAQYGLPDDVILSHVASYMGGAQEDDVRSPEGDKEQKSRAETSLASSSAVTSSRYSAHAVIADAPLRGHKRKATDAPLQDAEAKEPELKKFKKQ